MALAPYLVDFGRRIECLLRTPPFQCILWDFDLNHWDMGACAVLATALVQALRDRGFASASTYALLQSFRPHVNPPTQGHFVVGVSDDGPFLDSEGWHTASALLASHPDAHSTYVRIAKMLPALGNLDPDRAIVCPRDAVAALRDLIEAYIDTPFVVTYDESDDRYPVRLWTWRLDDNDGLAFFLDGIHDEDVDDPELSAVLAIVRGMVAEDPWRQSCIDV
ncbi:hypothetical protein pdul_cds_408 [Pandoravirus dulcis]|uniref:Uncharacterized protein n=1 Tax=Pandoravirus dulcis TaxID=1349409 RepID=S4VQ88_9VIRU|nr:hypothetical protein pdul_cds_408 [Pandoravirus dulcis]AGO82452.1 hypothetical protein pdul_cds_408 [Pandoravirus dulcis]